MGYREISLKLPADYNEDELRKGIGKELGIQEFSYQIENKNQYSDGINAAINIIENNA
ncbi:MAG: hypothetical protein Q8M34_10590 [Thermodesulfovibrionales bacterium]|nr:hypothetical protein [Thermodesulfovibrionales bacterium]